MSNVNDVIRVVQPREDIVFHVLLKIWKRVNITISSLKSNVIPKYPSNRNSIDTMG